MSVCALFFAQQCAAGCVPSRCCCCASRYACCFRLARAVPQSETFPLPGTTAPPGVGPCIARVPALLDRAHINLLFRGASKSPPTASLVGAMTDGFKCGAHYAPPPALLCHFMRACHLARHASTSRPPASRPPQHTGGWGCSLCTPATHDDLTPALLYVSQRAAVLIARPPSLCSWQ